MSSLSFLRKVRILWLRSYILLDSYHKFLNVLFAHLIPPRLMQVIIINIIFRRIVRRVMPQTFKLWYYYLDRFQLLSLWVDQWLFSQILLWFLLLNYIPILIFRRKSCINVFKNSNVHLGGGTVQHSVFQSILKFSMIFPFFTNVYLFKVIIVVWLIIE